MATPFEEVYQFFLSKVTDYSFVNFPENKLEEEFEKYLRSAPIKFFSAGTRLEKNLKFKELEIVNRFENRNSIIIDGIRVFKSKDHCY